MTLRLASLLAAFGLLLAPLSAGADHLDVLQMELQEDCDLAEFLEIVRDFNEYYKTRGYQAEIMTPVHNQDQTALFWVGRSPSTADFGKAHDHWLENMNEKGTPVQKLSDRFQECSTTTSRSSWVTVK